VNGHSAVRGIPGDVSEWLDRLRTRYRSASRVYVAGLFFATAVIGTLPMGRAVPATAIVRLRSDQSPPGFDATEMAAPRTVITINIVDASFSPVAAGPFSLN